MTRSSWALSDEQRRVLRRERVREGRPGPRRATRSRRCATGSRPSASARTRAPGSCTRWTRTTGARPTRTSSTSSGPGSSTTASTTSSGTPRSPRRPAQLLGVERLRFWHDQVFYKPPRHPGVVTWHQDYSYWTRTAPAGHLTCWIALDDSNEENGCLQLRPGQPPLGPSPLDLPHGRRWSTVSRSSCSPERAEAFGPSPWW